MKPAPFEYSRPANLDEACALLAADDGARLIAGGATNREIAAALFVAERTAKTHIEHILNKLGVGSRAQIAVWLTQHQHPGQIGPAIGQPTDARPVRRP